MVIVTTPTAKQPRPTLQGAPLLSIGLPVYNGQRYLADSMDALLAQTFTDFELIISDNASTDSTPEICLRYAAADSRIRYIRQPTNIGAAPNHRATLQAARGTYFKWASDDDLYAPQLLERCIEALSSDPNAVLAHAYEAFIDENGDLIWPVEYPLATADPDPAVRLRSFLTTFGGDDFYGVMRTERLRQVAELNSYHNADRTFMAQIVLQGTFVQVPELLYYRRDHPGRGEREPGVRARATNLDPRRADRWRHPLVRLRTEYIFGFVKAIWTADLSPRDRARCSAILGRWLLAHLAPDSAQRGQDSPDPALQAKAAAHRRRTIRRAS